VQFINVIAPAGGWVRGHFPIKPQVPGSKRISGLLQPAGREGVAIDDHVEVALAERVRSDRVPVDVEQKDRASPSNSTRVSAIRAPMTRRRYGATASPTAGPRCRAM
jgi:hypothetical protein